MHLLIFFNFKFVLGFKIIVTAVDLRNSLSAGEGRGMEVTTKGS
jgi:hypothetical protein